MLDVKLIGLGGVGSIVARYLFIYLNGKEELEPRLVLIDGDEFEWKNAQRMAFSDFGNKAEVVVDDITRPGESVEAFDGGIPVVAVPEYLSPKNKRKLIKKGDLVILCVDNHATRKMVNDHCSLLNDVILISGGNDGVDNGLRGTYGNVQVYIRQDGKDLTPSLAAYHPEIANPQDKHPEDVSCTEAILSTPQIIFANLQVASVICSTAWLAIENKLKHDEVFFDVQDAMMRPQKLAVPEHEPIEEVAHVEGNK